MINFPLAPAFVLIIIPFIGGLFIFSANKKNIGHIKLLSLWVTFFNLILSIFNLLNYKSEIIKYYDIPFLNNSILKYSTKTDSFSILFIFLISLISFLSVLWVMKKDTPKTKSFFISLLFFEALAISSFCAENIFWIFLCIESTIIVMYNMMFSGNNLKNSGYIFHFLIYSIISAFFILVSIILIFLETKTCNLSEIYKIGIKNMYVFYLLAIGIAIKMPIWPFCYWLPVVHVKSSTVCSVILSSIVLKFSTLLIVRFMLPLFSDILWSYGDIIFYIVILSMIFSVSNLFFVDDFKRFFAYFSIIHMNLYFLILLNKNYEGYFNFAILQHSFNISLMFFISNIIEKIFQTRSIKELKNSNIYLFKLNILILLGFLMLLCVPFSWGFISEVIAIYSAVNISLVYGCTIGFIILLLSTYSIFVYISTFKAWPNKNEEKTVVLNVIDTYKRVTLSILFFILFAIGIYPSLIFKIF